MVCPSISVTKFGYELSRASTARQSNPSAQYDDRTFKYSSGTPRLKSEAPPGAGSAHRVWWSRARSSSSSACGMSMRKGRISVLSGVLMVKTLRTLAEDFLPRSLRRSRDVGDVGAIVAVVVVAAGTAGLERSAAGREVGGVDPDASD